jgi:hypothetical protein|nr:S-layer homology domain-containing protein [uncultured Oscillibacter sp.]
MKRILAVFLSMLILTLAVPAALATKETSFSDVPISHWAFDEIETAVDKGITNGYSDGTFKPANSVTKNQFAVMLSRAFFPEDVAANQKIDDGQPWYWANLKTLNDRGLLEGTNLSDPNNWATRGGYSISRYEMAVLMYNILGEFGKSANAADMTAAQSKMSDWHFISPDYQDAVAACYALGVLSGYSDGTFGGEKPMNRAQGCVVIGRLEAFLEDGTTSTPSAELETPAETTKPENPGTTEESGTSIETTTGTLSNGKAITKENVLELLREIENEYPTGTSWDSSDSYTSPVMGSGSACAGFAYLVSDEIFGTSGNPRRVQNDHSNIRPGDMIQILKNGENMHWIVALGGIDSNGNLEAYVDGNHSGKVFWGWTDNGYNEDFYNSMNCTWVVYTRYPD